MFEHVEWIEDQHLTVDDALVAEVEAQMASDPGVDGRSGDPDGELPRFGQRRPHALRRVRQPAFEVDDAAAVGRGLDAAIAVVLGHRPLHRVVEVLPSRFVTDDLPVREGGDGILALSIGRTGSTGTNR